LCPTNRLTLHYANAQGRKGNLVQRMPATAQSLGYKLLLYISYCLAGRAFPTGDIPPSDARRVKWEVRTRCRSASWLTGLGWQAAGRQG